MTVGGVSRWGVAGQRGKVGTAEGGSQHPRAEAFQSFEELRRKEIDELEALAPRASAGVREAWEAWWGERRGG